MKNLERSISVLCALTTLGLLQACRSTLRVPRGEPVLSSEHLVVRSLPPRAESDGAQVLPLLHVGCTPGERFLALQVVIWDDIDDNGRRSPSEPSERWAMDGDGVRADSMEWRGLRLPPGDDLRAELDATLEHHGRFEGTWRVSPRTDS